MGCDQCQNVRCCENSCMTGFVMHDPHSLEPCFKNILACELYVSVTESGLCHKWSYV